MWLTIKANMKRADDVITGFANMVRTLVSKKPATEFVLKSICGKMHTELALREQAFSAARPRVCNMGDCFSSIATGPSDEAETHIKPLWGLFSAALSRSLIDHYYRGENSSIERKIPNWIEDGSRIVSAAVLLTNGLVVCSPRHFDDTMRSVCRHGNLDRHIPDSEQGFVDQFGRFFNRKQALIIAQAQGQIKNKSQPEDELFSEDLY
jgi:hypothetical protein